MDLPPIHTYIHTCTFMYIHKYTYLWVQALLCSSPLSHVISWAQELNTQHRLSPGSTLSLLSWRRWAMQLRPCKQCQTQHRSSSGCLWRKGVPTTSGPRSSSRRLGALHVWFRFKSCAECQLKRTPLLECLLIPGCPRPGPEKESAGLLLGSVNSRKHDVAIYQQVA